MLLGNAWGLLALLAIPAILAIHFFRRRFRPRPVTGLFLYGPAVRTVASGRTRQRILWRASLLAELLTALALAWYLTDPHFSKEQQARHLVIVLDSRWRMEAITPDGSIADRVKAVAHDRLEQLNRTDRVTVIASGREPQVICGPAARPDQADVAITKWTPDRPWHQLSGSLALGQSLGGETADILLISDRPLTGNHGDISLITVGSALATSGIAGANWWDDSEGQRLVVRLFAVGKSVTRTVQVNNGDQILLSRKVTITPKEQGTTIIPLPSDAPASLTLSLLGDDPLLRDDRIVLRKPVRKAVTVRVVGDNPWNEPLRKVLAILPDVSLVDDPQRAVHLLIGDGELDQTSGTWSLRFAKGDQAAVLGPFLQQRGHGILADIDFTGVLWSAGNALQSLDANETPLAIAGSSVLISEQRQRRDHHFTLYGDPKKSTLTNHPSWPSLIANLIALRQSALPGLRATTLTTAQPGYAILPPGVEQVDISDDMGHTVTLNADRDGLVIIPPRDRLGTYSLTLPDQKEVWEQFTIIPCDAQMADLSAASSSIHERKTNQIAQVERQRSMLGHLIPILLAALAAGFAWRSFTREEGLAP